jgi:hypothetical protein
MKRNISVSLDAALLGRVERLAQPGENRSALVERLLEHGLRLAEELELDSEYARAFPPGFVWPADRQRLHAAAQAAAAKHVRRRLGRADG